MCEGGRPSCLDDSCPARIPPTICSTENCFFFINHFLCPRWAQFWPKTNNYRGSKFPGPITQRYQPAERNDEDALTRAIIALASPYGRYGYRHITAKFKEAGWQVGKDRVERIWRREGLKVLQRQKPRSRLWLNDSLCVRLRPEHRNPVRSYDFVSAFTHDRRTVRILNLIGEYTRECLAIYVARRINSSQVIEVLADAMIAHGIPEYIRSDNGPEFVAKELRQWLAQTCSATLYIEPGSPWENGYCESFNSKLRDTIGYG